MNVSFKLLGGLLVLAGMAFGQVTDTGVKPAPDYDTMNPPPVGVTYVDPVFGSTIKRISDASNWSNADQGGGLNWVENEYATVSAFNSDNSKLILLHQSYFALYDGDGAYMHDLPMEINASSEPRWSRIDNSVLYYHWGNQLRSYNVATGGINIVHTFTEYSGISGRGESDISSDGDHFVFVGDDHEVFVFEISTGKKSNVFDVGGYPFDSVYITPDNNVTITWRQSGTERYTGIELFNTNMNFQRQVAHSGGHMDVTRDTNGDEVLIWTNSNDAQPLPNCNNGIVKIHLADGGQSCLAQLDWSLAVHIAAPDGNGMAYVDTEAPANPSPNSSGWVPYTNEILQVRLDGKGVTRLAHHRSRAVNSYVWQPKLAVNRDGTRLLFGSNFNQSAIQGYSNDYADTYLIELNETAPQPQPTEPEPEPDQPTTTPEPPPPSTTEVDWTRQEQDSTSVQLAGSWYPNQGGFNSGHSAVLAMETTSQLTFGFSGTGIKWIGYRDAWSGTAKVYLDNALAAEVDAYSANDQAQAVLFTANNLSDGAHTLRIVPSGRSSASGGSWIWVDAFDVAKPVAPSVEPPPAPAPEPTESAEPVLIEQNNPAVVLSGGTWSPNQTAPHSGGSAVLSMDSGAKATLSFTGTGVSWLGYRDQWSGVAVVWVDGVRKQTVDTYSGTSQAAAELYTISGLAPGTHTITIQVAGAGQVGHWVWVDAFRVTP